MRIWYARTHTLILLHNTRYYRRLKELVFKETASPAACHNCAYMCYVAQGLNDPEDRCHFENDPERPQYPCVYSSFFQFGADVDTNFGY